MIAVLMVAVATVVPSEEPTYFPDPNLQVVEQTLGIFSPTPTDMLALAGLSACERRIAEFTGLEYDINLEMLHLTGNLISDISVISALANLTMLDLVNNPLNTTAYFSYIPLFRANNPSIDLRYDSTPNPLTGDRATEPIDLALFAPHWVQTGCDQHNNRCGGADLNHQGNVDLSNSAIFARYQIECSDAFENAIAKFDNIVQRQIQADGMGAAAAAVVMNGQVIWKKGWGWRDIEQTIPADGNGVYRIGSITKSFTATAMMQLYEQRILKIDEPVYLYLSEIENLNGTLTQARSITFRQLASHMSGLKKEPHSGIYASGPIEEWENKALAAIPDTQFRADPGDSYRYSSIGFAILGLALSRPVTDKSYIDIVHQKILQPLGMNHSGFILTPQMWPLLAEGIQNNDGTIDTQTPADQHAGRGYKVPSGGLYSTIEDMTRFIAVHTGSATTEIISNTSLAEMHSIQTQPGSKAGQGLGFKLVQEDDCSWFVWHGGGIPGYDAVMWFHPQTRLGVVMLRSYRDGNNSLRPAVKNLIRTLVALQNQT